MGGGEQLEMTTTRPDFPSPGASPYSEDDRGVLLGIPKGWCSERVPHRYQRHVGARAALVPFGSGSGRAFPSKWDDAERWISGSPGSVPNNYYYATGVAKVSSSSQSQMGLGRHKYQRRAKSKSGPLGQAGLTSYASLGNSFSPVLGMGVIHGGRWRNSVAVESPASLRARLEEGTANGGGGEGEREGARRSCPGRGDADWLDLWSGPPSPTIQGNTTLEENTEGLENNNEPDKNNENGDEEAIVDGGVSRRDMATQMYPDDHEDCESFSSSPCSSVGDDDDDDDDDQPSNYKNNNVESPEYDHYEVRDVQVDKQTSTTRRSASSEREEIQDTTLVTTFMEAADKKFSKLEKEESRINAWENLQKAKAEAALQKLEMKLEKKRSSAMEKIIEKLRRAEIKAEKMRSSLSTGNNDVAQNQAVSRTTSKIPSFCKKIRLTSSTKNCTTCYPF